METIIAIISTVPTWVWIVGGLCVCLPTFGYAIKRGIKVFMYIGIIAAILFIFPSIGSAFMDTAGLVWDAETKTLTNMYGQQITLKLPDNIKVPEGAEGVQLIEWLKNSENLTAIVKDIANPEKLTAADIVGYVKTKTGLTITEEQATWLKQQIIKLRNNVDDVQPITNETTQPKNGNTVQETTEQPSTNIDINTLINSN